MCSAVGCGYIGIFESQKFASAEMPLCPNCVKSAESRMQANKRNLGVGSLRPRILLYNES